MTRSRLEPMIYHTLDKGANKTKMSPHPISQFKACLFTVHKVYIKNIYDTIFLYLDLVIINDHKLNWLPRYQPFKCQAIASDPCFITLVPPPYTMELHTIMQTPTRGQGFNQFAIAVQAFPQ